MIFLSYSRLDAQQADMWVENLERSGYRVWIDRAGIRGGAQWKATIVRSIQEAQARVCGLRAHGGGCGARLWLILLGFLV